MTNAINISGTIGTQMYLLPYFRNSSEALELTPAWRKTNMNGTIVQDISIAGMYPISASLNGFSTDWKYKTFNVSTAITPAATQVLKSADYALFKEGKYYQNTKTFEIFYVVSKNEGFSITFKRGLLGSNPNQIATTDNVIEMSTVVFDSGTGSETVGKFTLTKGTAPMVAGDNIVINIDGIQNSFIIGTDISAGTNLNAQATNIADKLNITYDKWVFTASSGNVVATQRVGYGKPFVLIFSCTASVAANALTHNATGDTAGVAKTYTSGSGMLIYQEMPRNPAFGQPVLPSYNYNINK